MRTHRSKHSGLFLFLALFVLVAASPVNAVTIKLDVDAADAPASETQSPDFVRMTVAGMNGNSVNGTLAPTATVDGVTVTATQTVGASRGFRDRGVPNATVPPPPFQDVQRDFIFAEGTDGAEITVTIANLPSGQFEITSFNHDFNVASNDDFFDILVTDALGIDQLKIDNADFDNGASDFGHSFLVQSNGINDVVLRIIEDSATNRTRFNGITIQSIIPEPATAALGLLSLGGLLMRRRRIA